MCYQLHAWQPVGGLHSVDSDTGLATSQRLSIGCSPSSLYAVCLLGLADTDFYCLQAC
jgi:hypothetical protein